jgi:hypothetical protein
LAITLFKECFQKSVLRSQNRTRYRRIIFLAGTSA